MPTPKKLCSYYHRCFGEANSLGAVGLTGSEGAKKLAQKAEGPAFHEREISCAAERWLAMECSGSNCSFHERSRSRNGASRGGDCCRHNLKRSSTQASLPRHRIKSVHPRYGFPRDLESCSFPIDHSHLHVHPASGKLNAVHGAFTIFVTFRRQWCPPLKRSCMFCERARLVGLGFNPDDLCR